MTLGIPLYLLTAKRNTPSFLIFLSRICKLIYNKRERKSRYFKCRANKGLRIDNRIIRKRGEICSKLTVKTLERHRRLLLTLNIFHAFLNFLLLNLNNLMFAGYFSKENIKKVTVMIQLLLLLFFFFAKCKVCKIGFSFIFMKRITYSSPTL